MILLDTASCVIQNPFGGPEIYFVVEDAKSYDEVPKTIVDIGIPYVNPDKSFTRNLSSRPHEPKGAPAKQLAVMVVTRGWWWAIRCYVKLA